MILNVEKLNVWLAYSISKTIFFFGDNKGVSSFGIGGIGVFKDVTCEEKFLFFSILECQKHSVRRYIIAKFNGEENNNKEKK